MLINAHLQRRLLAISVTVLVVNLALNLVLIPLYSYVGAAAATVVTEVAVLALQVRVLHRELALRWPAGSLVRVAVASAVMAATMIPLYGAPALLQLLVGSVAFLIALIGVRGLRWSDLAPLRRRAKPEAGPAAG